MNEHLERTIETAQLLEKHLRELSVAATAGRDNAMIIVAGQLIKKCCEIKVDLYQLNASWEDGE